MTWLFSLHLPQFVAVIVLWFCGISLVLIQSPLHERDTRATIYICYTWGAFALYILFGDKIAKLF
jgi:threonine/homoserine efflux transporter RhtA